MSDDELSKRAHSSTGQAGIRNTNTVYYQRDPYVAEYAKRWAKGICQLCENSAPFVNKKGEPFLHTHHIQWLSRGGEDTVENTIALCPNCHERMHVLNGKGDVEKLKTKVQQHFTSCN
nr:HNH endonuclease signature motif containing protein [Alteribacillus bidgolensis]